MAAAIPIALMVGGAMAKNAASAKQADQQRSQLNAALTRTGQTQQKANGLIEGEAAKLSPVARAAAMSLQADQNTAAARSDLAASGATDSGGNAIINTAGDNGAVSKEFLTSKADRALAEGSRLTAIARQLAQLRAPDQLQQQEGQDRADLTQELGSMWGTTQHLNDANTATAQNVPLPGYAALGDVAQAAGAAYGGKSKGLGLKTGKGAAGGYVWTGGDTTSGGGFA